MVATMIFMPLLGILAGLIDAVLIPPWPLKVPTATQQVAEVSNAPIAITDVTVVDVITGAHRTNLTVLIRNGRIEAIAPRISVPIEATRLDGKGKFLIPGLWDMHSHHQGTGADCVDLFVAKGVVGTRDMGGDADFILPCAERSLSNVFSLTRPLEVFYRVHPNLLPRPGLFPVLPPPNFMFCRNSAFCRLDSTSPGVALA
jgi:hypothetical protein